MMKKKKKKKEVMMSKQKMIMRNSMFSLCGYRAETNT